MIPSILALALLQEPASPTAFPELGLELAIPELEDLRAVSAQTDQLRGRWSGTLDGVALDISLFRIPLAQFGIDSPEDVTDLVELNVPPTGERPFRFERVELLDGDYGYAPFASLAQGRRRGPDGSFVASLHALGGRAEGWGWSLEVASTPAATPAVEKVVRDFFEEGVRYDGPTWDHEWSDEEVEARWKRDAPPDLADDLEVVRTAHYVLMGNAGGKLFAKKMEECYKTVRKVFPFDEVKKRRLMPVFVFRTPDQYYEFYSRIAGISIGEAQRTKGHAWRDYYATWYEAPNDPVHVHEATHQIFHNRLRLGGGGSWFQEGVAEYVETRENERNEAAFQVKKGRHRRLPDFFRLESLIYSTDGDDVKGGSEAGDLYKQAALLIEFLRESKFGKARFQDFVRTVGRVAPNDLEAIDAALMEVYEVDSRKLDELFVEYCEKR